MSGELAALRRCFQPRQWFRGEGEPDPFTLDDGETFMWIYRKGADELFEVGYFTPDFVWFTDSSYATKDGAAARVNYLNGGRG